MDFFSNLTVNLDPLQIRYILNLVFSFAAETSGGVGACMGVLDQRFHGQEAEVAGCTEEGAFRAGGGRGGSLDL